MYSPKTFTAGQNVPGVSIGSENPTETRNLGDELEIRTDVADRARGQGAVSRGTASYKSGTAHLGHERSRSDTDYLQSQRTHPGVGSVLGRPRPELVSSVVASIYLKPRQLCASDEEYLDAISAKLASASLVILGQAQELKDFAARIVSGGTTTNHATSGDVSQAQRGTSSATSLPPRQEEFQQVLGPYVQLLTILETLVLGDFPVETLLHQRPHILQSLLRVFNEFHIFPAHDLPSLEGPFTREIGVAPTSVALPSFAAPRAALEVLHQITRKLVSRWNLGKHADKDRGTRTQPPIVCELPNQQPFQASPADALVEGLGMQRTASNVTCDLVIDSLATADSAGYVSGPDGPVIATATLYGPKTAISQWYPFSPSLDRGETATGGSTDLPDCLTDLDYLTSTLEDEDLRVLRQLYPKLSLTVDLLQSGPQLTAKTTNLPQGTPHAEPLNRFGRTLFGVATAIISRSAALTGHIVPLLCDTIPLLFAFEPAANSECHQIFETITSIASSALNALDQSLHHAVPLGAGSAILSSFSPGQIDLITLKLNEPILRSAVPVPIISVVLDLINAAHEAFRTHAHVFKYSAENLPRSQVVSPSKAFARWIAESFAASPRILTTFATLLTSEVFARTQPWLHMRMLKVIRRVSHYFDNSAAGLAAETKLTSAAVTVIRLLDHRQKCLSLSRALVAPFHIVRTLQVLLDTERFPAQSAHSADVELTVKRLGAVRWALFLTHMQHIYFPLSLFPNSAAGTLGSGKLGSSLLADSPRHPFPSEFAGAIVAAGLSTLGRLPLISISDWTLKRREYLQGNLGNPQLETGLDTTRPIILSAGLAFDTAFEAYHELILAMLRHPSPRIRTELLLGLLGRARTFSRAQAYPIVQQSSNSTASSLGQAFNLSLSMATGEAERCARDAVDSATSPSNLYSSGFTVAHSHIPIISPSSSIGPLSLTPEASPTAGSTLQLNLFQRKFHLATPSACLPFLPIVHDAAAEFERGASCVSGTNSAMDGAAGILALLACTTPVAIESLLQIVLDAGLDEDPDLDDAERGLGTSGAQNKVLTLRHWARVGVSTNSSVPQSISSRTVDCDIVARCQRLETGQTATGYLSRRAQREYAIELLSLLVETLPMITKPVLRTHYRLLHLAGLTYAPLFSLVGKVWDEINPDAQLASALGTNLNIRQPRFPEPASAIERAEAPARDLLCREHAFSQVVLLVTRNRYHARSGKSPHHASSAGDDIHQEAMHRAQQRSLHESLRSLERARNLTALAALEPRYGRHLSYLASAIHQVASESANTSLLEANARAMEALRKLELTWQGILHPKPVVRARAATDLWKCEAWAALRKVVRMQIQMSRVEAASILGPDAVPDMQQQIKDLISKNMADSTMPAPESTGLLQQLDDLNSVRIPLLVALAGPQLGRALMGIFRAAAVTGASPGAHSTSVPARETAEESWLTRLDMSRVAREPSRIDPLDLAANESSLEQAHAERVHEEGTGSEAGTNAELFDQMLGCNRAIRLNPPLALSSGTQLASFMRVRALWERSATQQTSATVAGGFSQETALREARAALRVLAYERPTTIGSSVQGAGQTSASRSLAVYVASCARLAELALERPSIVLPLLLGEEEDSEMTGAPHAEGQTPDRETSRVALFVLVDLLRSPLMLLPCVCDAAAKEVASAAGLQQSGQAMTMTSSQVSLLPSESAILSELAITALQVWFCLIVWLTQDLERAWLKRSSALGLEDSVNSSATEALPFAPTGRWQRIVDASSRGLQEHGGVSSPLSPLVRLLLLEPLGPLLFHPHSQVRCLAAACATLVLYNASTPFPAESAEAQEGLESAPANCVPKNNCFILTAHSRSLSRVAAPDARWALWLPSCLHSSVFSVLPVAMTPHYIPRLQLCQSPFLPGELGGRGLISCPPEAVLSTFIHLHALESEFLPDNGTSALVSKRHRGSASYRTSANAAAIKMLLPGLPSIPPFLQNLLGHSTVPHTSWNARKAVSALSAAKSAMALVLALSDVRLCARLLRKQRAWLTFTHSRSSNEFDPLRELLPCVTVVREITGELDSTLGSDKNSGHLKEVGAPRAQIHHLVSTLTSDFGGRKSESVPVDSVSALLGALRGTSQAGETGDEAELAIEIEGDQPPQAVQSRSNPLRQRTIVAPVRFTVIKAYYCYVSHCPTRSLRFSPLEHVEDIPVQRLESELVSREVKSQVSMLSSLLPSVASTSEFELISESLTQAPIVLRIIRTVPLSLDDEVVLTTVLSALALTLPIAPTAGPTSRTTIQPVVDSLDLHVCHSGAHLEKDNYDCDTLMDANLLRILNQLEYAPVSSVNLFASTPDMTDDAHLLRWSSLHFNNLTGLLLRLLPCESWDEKTFPSASLRTAPGGSDNPMPSSFHVPQMSIQDLCSRLSRGLDGRGRTVVRALSAITAAIGQLAEFIREPQHVEKHKIAAKDQALVSEVTPGRIPTKLAQQATIARVIRLGVFDEILEGPLLALLQALVTAGTQAHVQWFEQQKGNVDLTHAIAFEEHQILLSLASIALSAIRSALTIESLVARMSQQAIAAAADCAVSFLSACIVTTGGSQSCISVTELRGESIQLQGATATLTQTHSSAVTAALHILALCCCRVHSADDDIGSISKTASQERGRSVDADTDLAMLGDLNAAARLHTQQQIARRRRFAELLSMAVVRSRLIAVPPGSQPAQERGLSPLGVLLEHRDVRVRTAALALIACIVEHGADQRADTKAQTNSTPLNGFRNLALPVLLRVFSTAAAGVTQVLASYLPTTPKLAQIRRILTACTALTLRSASSNASQPNYYASSLTPVELMWVGRILCAIPPVSPIASEETAQALREQSSPNDLLRGFAVQTAAPEDVAALGSRLATQSLQTAIKLVATLLECGSALAVSVPQLKPLLARFTSDVLSIHSLQADALVRPRCFSELLALVPDPSKLLRPALLTAAASVAALSASSVRDSAEYWLKTYTIVTDYSARYKASILRRISQHPFHYQELVSAPFYEDFSAVSFEQCEAAIGCLLGLLQQDRLQGNISNGTASARFLESKDHPHSLVKLFIILSCSIEIRAQARRPDDASSSTSDEDQEELRQIEDSVCGGRTRDSRATARHPNRGRSKPIAVPYLPPLSTTRLRIIELLLELFGILAWARPALFLSVVHTAVNQLCAPVHTSVTQTFPALSATGELGVDLTESELLGVAGVTFPTIHPWFGYSSLSSVLRSGATGYTTPYLFSATAMISALSKWITLPYSLGLARSAAIAITAAEGNLDTVHLPALGVERTAKMASTAASIITRLLLALQPLRRDEAINLAQLAHSCSTGDMTVPMSQRVNSKQELKTVRFAPVDEVKTFEAVNESVNEKQPRRTQGPSETLLERLQQPSRQGQVEAVQALGSIPLWKPQLRAVRRERAEYVDCSATDLSLERCESELLRAVPAPEVLSAMIQRYVLQHSEDGLPVYHPASIALWALFAVDRDLPLLTCISSGGPGGLSHESEFVTIVPTLNAAEFRLAQSSLLLHFAAAKAALLLPPPSCSPSWFRAACTGGGISLRPTEDFALRISSATKLAAHVARQLETTTLASFELSKAIGIIPHGPTSISLTSDMIAKELTTPDSGALAVLTCESHIRTRLWSAVHPVFLSPTTARDWLSDVARAMPSSSSGRATSNPAPGGPFTLKASILPAVPLTALTAYEFWIGLLSKTSVLMDSLFTHAMKVSVLHASVAADANAGRGLTSRPRLRWGIELPCQTIRLRPALGEASESEEVDESTSHANFLPTATAIYDTIVHSAKDTQAVGASTDPQVLEVGKCDAMSVATTSARHVPLQVTFTSAVEMALCIVLAALSHSTPALFHALSQPCVLAVKTVPGLAGSLSPSELTQLQDRRRNSKQDASVQMTSLPVALRAVATWLAKTREPHALTLPRVDRESEPKRPHSATMVGKSMPSHVYTSSALGSATPQAAEFITSTAAKQGLQSKPVGSTTTAPPASASTATVTLAGVLNGGIIRHSSRIEPAFATILTLMASSLDPVAPCLPDEEQHAEMHLPSEIIKHASGLASTPERVFAGPASSSSLRMLTCDKSPAIALLATTNSALVPVPMPMGVAAEVNLHQTNSQPSSVQSKEDARAALQAQACQFIHLFEFVARRIRSLTAQAVATITTSESKDVALPSKLPGASIRSKDRAIALLGVYCNLAISLLSRPEVSDMLYHPAGFVAATADLSPAISSPVTSSLVGWLTQKIAAFLAKLTRVLSKKTSTPVSDYWIQRLAIATMTLTRLLEFALRTDSGLMAFSAAVFPKEDALLIAIREFHAAPRHMRTSPLNDAFYALLQVQRPDVDLKEATHEAVANTQGFIASSIAQAASLRLAVPLPALSWGLDARSASGLVLAAANRVVYADSEDSQGGQLPSSNTQQRPDGMWSNDGFRVAGGVTLCATRNNPTLHWGSPLPFVIWAAALFPDPTSILAPYQPFGTPLGDSESSHPDLETDASAGAEELDAVYDMDTAQSGKSALQRCDIVSMLWLPDGLMLRSPLKATSYRPYDVALSKQRWSMRTLPTVAANTAPRLQDPVYRIGSDCGLILHHVFSARAGDLALQSGSGTLRSDAGQGTISPNAALTAVISNPVAIPHMLSCVVSSVSVASEALHWQRFASGWISRMLRPEGFIVGNHVRGSLESNSARSDPQRTQDQAFSQQLGMNPHIEEISALEASPPPSMLWFGASSVVSATPTASSIPISSKAYEVESAECARLIAHLVPQEGLQSPRGDFDSPQTEAAARLASPLGVGFSAALGIEALARRSARAVAVLRSTRVTVPGSRFARRLWSTMKPITSQAMGYPKESKARSGAFGPTNEIGESAGASFNSSAAAVHAALGPFAHGLLKPSLPDVLLTPLWFSIAMPLFKPVSNGVSINAQAGATVPTKPPAPLAAQLALHIAPLESAMALAPAPAPTRPLEIAAIATDALNRPGVLTDTEIGRVIPVLATSSLFCDVVASLSDTTLMFSGTTSAAYVWNTVPDVVRLARSTALPAAASSVTAAISGNAADTAIQRTRVVRSSTTGSSSGGTGGLTASAPQASTALLFELTPATLLSALREVLRLYVAELSIRNKVLCAEARRAQYQLIRRAELEGILTPSAASAVVRHLRVTAHARSGQFRPKRTELEAAEDFAAPTDSDGCGLCAFAGLLRLYFGLGSVHILRDPEHHLHAAHRETLLALRGMTSVTCPACNTVATLMSIERTLSILIPAPPTTSE